MSAVVAAAMQHRSRLLGSSTNPIWRVVGIVSANWSRKPHPEDRHPQRRPSSPCLQPTAAKKIVAADAHTRQDPARLPTSDRQSLPRSCARHRRSAPAPQRELIRGVYPRCIISSMPTLSSRLDRRQSRRSMARPTSNVQRPTSKPTSEVPTKRFRAKEAKS